MTSSADGDVRPLVEARREVSSPYLIGAALTVFLAGLLALASAAVGLVDSDRDAGVFGVSGAVLIAIATVVLTRAHLAAQPRRDQVFGAAIVCMLALAAVSVVEYLLTGEIDRLDDAIFESVSGVTTTGITTIPDPALLSDAVLFWRAGTQWIGGLIAVAFVVHLLPNFGGGTELTAFKGQRGSRRALAPRANTGVRRSIVLYCALSVMAMVVFLLAGMGRFHAVTYAATTISTGGFAAHDDSIAAFGSASVEWAVTGMMFLGGLSLAVIWSVINGRVQALLNTVETRVYLGFFFLSAALISIWNWSEGASVHTTIRHATFTVASAMSTTGHRVAAFNDWSWGGRTLLLFLIGVGAMWGAVGGGFRWLRVIEAVQYLRRELTEQLHPRAVVAAKLDGRPIPEENLDRMNSQQVLVTAGVLLGGFGLAAFGADVIGAISGAISALSTFGPHLGETGELSSYADVSSVGRGGRWVLVVLMFAGRFAIYPVLFALGTVLLSRRRIPWR